MDEHRERVCRRCRRPPRGCECPPLCGYCGEEIEPAPTCCCTLQRVEHHGRYARAQGTRIQDSPFLDEGSFYLRFGLPASMRPKMHRAWVRGWNSE